MRAIVVCIAVGLAASFAAAQKCDAVDSDPFSVAVSPNCATVTTCQTALCTCLGSSSTTYPGCVTAVAKSACTNAATCLGTYNTCLLATTATRLNTTNNCNALGSAIYVAQLAAATSATLNTTALYKSCVYQACTLSNKTGAFGNCEGDNVLPLICNSATLLGVTATLAPVSTTPVIVVTLRLSGASWAAVLNDPTKKAAAITAITNDLATLLGIDARFIVIISLSVGSLVVQFSVQDGSGKTAAQLSTAVGTATTSSTWLSSTSSVYSAVGSDSIGVTSVSATTAAPGQTLPPNTPAPTGAPTSSAIGLAGGVVAAVAAAVLALV